MLYLRGQERLQKRIAKTKSLEHENSDCNNMSERFFLVCLPPEL